MPKGGFGNLIALPLQKVPGESGFTEFLDDELRPHADQWSYLASIQRVSQSQTERLIAEALQQGDLIGVRIACMDDDDQPDPWTLPPSRKRPDKRLKDRFLQVSKLSGLICSLSYPGWSQDQRFWFRSRL
jgi:hypothetical protein